jgi:hypothetical protein
MEPDASGVGSPQLCWGNSLNFTVKKTKVILKVFVFWDLSPCRLVDTDRRLKRSLLPPSSGGSRGSKPEGKRPLGRPRTR